MSRSFHGNIRKYIREKNYHYSNDDIKEEHLNQISEELWRKRFTKTKTIQSRKRENKAINCNGVLDPKSIEIRVLEKGRYIHFPASKDDLIGVIERMPYNVLSGIDSITFCLGKEYQEDKVDNLYEVNRDPYTARICTNEEGPIYTPPTLGTYYTGSCKIFIYAYVYDREGLKLNIIESYLRLQMLSTLVHEIAHHEDNILRTSRGKWLGFNDWKCEDYAELQQMNWSETAVIPYLMSTYPDEYIALSNWIEKYGGVRFSLVKLSGESRGRKIGNKVKLVFSASSAVENLLKNIIDNINERDAMLEFAKDLHYGDYYEECLKALNTLLLKNPKDSDALGIKADTYIHQEKYIIAEETAKECLLIDKVNIDAIGALCDVKQNIKDWQGLKEISKLGIEAVGNDIFELSAFTEMRIIALLHLKEYEEAGKDVYSLPRMGMQHQRNLAFEALVKLTSGDLDNAFKIAKNILEKEKVIGPAGAILKAVYNYVLCNQGNGIKMYNLNEYEQSYLINTDIMDLLK